MKGVVLAAGLGLRLGSLTGAVPKALMPVGQRTCLDVVLATLAPAVSEILVVTGYLGNTVREHVACAACAVPVRCVENPRPDRGNLLSLAAAAPDLRRGGSGFVVVNADHLFPPDFFGRSFRPRPDEVTIACQVGRPILEDEMKVVLGDGDAVLAIDKRLERFDGAYIGVTAVPAAAQGGYWAAFDAVRRDDPGESAVVEHVLARLARDGRPPVACRVDAGLPWFEIDTPEDLERAREALG